MFKVSIIVPAFNADRTISAVCDSLLQQTFPDWECIIVDDGSTDQTASIVANFAETDSRIRFVRSPHEGVSAARNTGIRETHCDWLMFLDSDDWLSPDYLARMIQALDANPGLDAVHCGWRRVAADGAMEEAQFCPPGDLFERFCCYCAFPIHSCIVRRTLVETVGGFDTSLRTCQDWDLWQRIARTGARFLMIRKALAFYRMRPESGSKDGHQFLTDSLRVVMRGHSADPRVPVPHPAYASGRSSVHLSRVKFFLASWAAGLVLPSGANPVYLLELIGEARDPGLHPRDLAEAIFYSVLYRAGQKPSRWIELLPAIQTRLDEFLAALEKQSLAPELAVRTRIRLERMILEHTAAVRPLLLRGTYAIRVEITEPLSDIRPNVSAQLLNCLVECEGLPVGTLNLPICDGIVHRAVLADAISNELAWPILGKFFERTIYGNLQIHRDSDKCTIRRGNVVLAETTAEFDRPVGTEFHDCVGWAVFLQELWGRPGFLRSQFYETWIAKERPIRRSSVRDLAVIEVSDELPDLDVSQPPLRVILRAGGVELGVVEVPAKGRVVRAQELRATLTAAGGLELCRIAVREALLGRPLLAPGSLRDRLALAATQHLQSAAIAYGEKGLVLGRRLPQTIGAGTSRWAALPAAVTRDVLEASTISGEPVLPYPEGNDRPKFIVYAPDRLSNGTASRQITKSTASKEIQSELRSKQKPGHALWWRGPWRRKPVPSVSTDRLPILLYRHVLPNGGSGTPEHSLTPKAFEEQLSYLKKRGYYSTRLDEWYSAMSKRRPLPGRAVLITFDDGYRAFYTFAWPLLKRYGFSASLFLVADEIGGTNKWNRAYENERPLLGWDEIKELQREGIDFGSHSATHRPLTGLSVTAIVREAIRSRMILERGLQVPVRSFAYPYGDVDPVVQHLIGACGFIFGLSCHSSLCGFQDPLLALPRLEMSGLSSFADFVARLSH